MSSHTGPSKPKRARGPYKQYLEPDRPLVIPKSTKWSKREKNRKRQQPAERPEEDYPAREGGSVVDDLEENMGRNEEEQNVLEPRSDQGESCSPAMSWSNDLDSQSLASEEEPYEECHGVIDSSGGPCSNSSGEYGSGSQDSISELEQELCSDHESNHHNDRTCSDEEENPNQESPPDLRSDIVSDGSSTCPMDGASESVLDHACMEETQGQTKNKLPEKWNEPVHNALSVSHFEIFLMVFHLFIRHSMTYSLVEDILKMINVILGSSVLKSSEYIFKKLFMSNCKVITHIYCTKCEMYLGKQDELKEKLKVQLQEKLNAKNSIVTCACGNQCNVNKLDENFFVTVNIAESLKYLLRRPNLKLMSPRNRNVDFYADVLDGEVYDKEIRPEIESGKNCLTLTFNTDGARVFRSKKKSMWPIQFSVSEIAPEERFKDENILLCGLWYGQGTPNMTTFLNPLSKELNSLAKDGVDLVDYNGQKKRYHVFAPITSVDSGAKPKLSRQKAHNGRFSCGFCFHPNLPVPGFPANQLRFLVKDADRQVMHFENRTHASMIQDMLKADELDRKGQLKKSSDGSSDDHVNGLLGISCLAGFPKFDLVKGFAFDYLHTMLLGNLATLLKHLFDGPASAEIPVIDKRLIGIKPPHSMSTETRLLSKRNDWKGKELRLFGLYYALPCLKGLQRITTRQYEHLRKFVIALQILLGSTITEEQLDYAESLLDKFVTDFEDLYGPIMMTLNVHLLKHVVNVVRSLGPLWCYSTFSFESGNGKLRNLVKGTNGVVAQICQKYLAVLTVSDFLEDCVVKDNVLNFCSNIMNFKYVKKIDKIDENTTCLGRPNVVKVSAEEKTAILNSGLSSSTEISFILYFNRILHKGTAYYSRAYKKPTIFDDTCVKLLDGTFCVTEKFIKLTEQSGLHVIIRPIRISQQTGEKLAPLIWTGAFHFWGTLKVIKVEDIASKCVLMEFEDYKYVAELPNSYERD